MFILAGEYAYPDSRYHNSPELTGIGKYSGEMAVYHTADGQAVVSLYARDGHVWMNQNQLAELFATSRPIARLPREL